MASQKTVVYFGAGLVEPPPLIIQFGKAHGLTVEHVPTPDDVYAYLNRSFPACVVLDGSDSPNSAFELCEKLKGDAFTSIVPIVLLVANRTGDAGELATGGLRAGADEVMSDATSDKERALRLELVLRRASRDVNVHPTTHLPGTVQIERDLGERMATGGHFGVCYADLDHFKEFNDRYGYNCGDSVILLTSRILRDIVRALAPGGFVGHIGGDDFIFNVSLEHLEVTCDEIIQLFDELIPYQYTEEDRKAGYFLGKDRRGSIHRIPLMTLSIGIVTNQLQEFSHTAQIAELAGEMKTYAKTLHGSVYVVDRRYGTGETEGNDEHPALRSSDEDVDDTPSNPHHFYGAE